MLANWVWLVFAKASVDINQRPAICAHLCVQYAQSSSIRSLCRVSEIPVVGWGQCIAGKFAALHTNATCVTSLGNKSVSSPISGNIQEPRL
jgi:hypothetical protein